MTSGQPAIIRVLTAYAATLAAYFFCATMTLAETVTYQNAEGSFAVTGRFIGFDGDNISLLTDGGPVTLAAADLSCVGAPCPDLQNHVPVLRMIGAERMTGMLMPALLEGYARDQGLTISEDDGRWLLVSDPDGPVISVVLTAAAPGAAFDAFVDHRADALLSLRELRPAEVQAAHAAGLGRVTVARQARILALDALVPVTTPGSAQRFTSLADVTAVLAGTSDVFDPYLPADLSGLLEGFEDRFMTPFGLALARPDTGYSDIDALRLAIESAENGLALLPFGEVGNTQPLKLSGPCGVVSQAELLSLKTEDYPLTFPVLLYLPQRRLHPRIDDFLDWLRSPSAHLVIRRVGLADLAAVPIPLAEQGERLAHAITNAGREVPLSELQRLVRLLGPRVRMSNTFRFEPGSTRLDGQSRSNVMQIAQSIRDGRFAGQELLFVGFSDGVGPAAANRDLSSTRAETVRRAVLRALGERVPDTVLIETDAFGEALPMACDDAIWGQQTNRRVELWVGPQARSNPEP